MGILKQIKLANEAVRKGNAYRNSIDMERPKMSHKDKIERLKSLKPKNVLPFIVDKDTMEKIEKFKSKFEYWEGWSGSRFVREKNPNPTKETVKGSVCRSNPVTGQWEAV